MILNDIRLYLKDIIYTDYIIWGIQIIMMWKVVGEIFYSNPKLQKILLIKMNSQILVEFNED